MQAMLNTAIQAARRAGDIAIRSLSRLDQLEIKAKARNEYVTQVDQAAEQAIIESIHKRYPDHAILAEESGRRGSSEFVWIIDPLDGTKEFIARNGEFSIMIGLAIHGKAVMGVIMQPDPGLLYVGAVNHGAFLHEEGESIPLAVSDKSSINQMIMVSSRSHRQQIVDKVRKELHITSERVSGSVGLKVGLISRQLADLYIHPSPGCKEWDICAPAALLEAAGGTITDCWGEPIVFNKRDVRAHNGLMATNGQTHEKVVEVVARICEEFGFNQDDGFW